LSFRVKVRGFGTFYPNVEIPKGAFLLQNIIMFADGMILAKFRGFGVQDLRLGGMLIFVVFYRRGGLSRDV
jgi:hypothetical protein